MVPGGIGKDKEKLTDKKGVPLARDHLPLVCTFLHCGIHSSPLHRGSSSDSRSLFKPHMATFTHYQPPRTVAPAPPGKYLHPTSPHGLPASLHLPAGMPSERSWQSTGLHTLKNRDSMEVVDLTDSDQEGPTPKRQATEDGQPGAEGEGT